MERNADFYKTDDIISYKVENGIVYGYYNQISLDIALYNRAKKLTENFTNRKKWDGNIYLRAVKPDDIFVQRHSITFRPVSDGTYISEGDFFLEVGLDKKSFKAYLSKKNISQENTMLENGIALYSSYSGIYSNKIDDIIIDNTNNGNIIKDGDLLFTIRLTAKPKETESPVNEVKFSYNMLSKEFLEKIPNHKICIYKWMVGNYTRVETGDDILELAESTYMPKHRTSIKSPFSGVLVKHYVRNETLLDKKLFTIYSDESRLKDLYPNEIIIFNDDFTKSVTIKGQKCGGNTLGFSLNKNIININFENVSGNNYLLLSFNRKAMNLNKKCSIHLLLSDDSVITLNAIANPVKSTSSYSEAKFRIYAEDMVKLETKEFVKWQITNEEGIEILSGENKCCFWIITKDLYDIDYYDIAHERYDASIIKKLSYEVFQDFVRDFNKAVRDNTLAEDYKEVNKVDIKEKECCYVYLMVDTTNNFHKIGISNNPRYREHTLQSDKPTIELLCAKKYPTRAIAEAIESALHNVYANKRIRGEWFNLDASDVEIMKQTLR